MAIWITALLLVLTLSALFGVVWFCLKLQRRIDTFLARFSEHKTFISVDPDSVILRSVRDS